MNGIVGLGASVPLSAGGSAARPSAALDAQLNTCRAQLADWVTCDSAKTPEGKAKIAQITAKADSLKQQIASAAKTQAAHVGLRSAAPAPHGPVGTQLDTWA